MLRRLAPCEEWSGTSGLDGHSDPQLARSSLQPWRQSPSLQSPLTSLTMAPHHRQHAGESGARAPGGDSELADTQTVNLENGKYTICKI